jgi:hypothetical protein
MPEDAPVNIGAPDRATLCGPRSRVSGMQTKLHHRAAGPIVDYIGSHRLSTSGGTALMSLPPSSNFERKRRACPLPETFVPVQRLMVQKTQGRRLFAILKGASLQR